MVDFSAIPEGVARVAAPLYLGFVSILAARRAEEVHCSLSKTSGRKLRFATYERRLSTSRDKEQGTLATRHYIVTLSLLNYVLNTRN